jgi:hypothetical protein
LPIVFLLGYLLLSQFLVQPLLPRQLVPLVEYPRLLPLLSVRIATLGDLACALFLRLGDALGRALLGLDLLGVLPPRGEPGRESLLPGGLTRLVLEGYGVDVDLRSGGDKIHFLSRSSGILSSRRREKDVASRPRSREANLTGGGGGGMRLAQRRDKLEGRARKVHDSRDECHIFVQWTIIHLKMKPQ